MTKISLARRIELTPRTISMLEAGDREPSAETLAFLARALNFPEAFFLGPDIEEPSVDGASFRALASMTASQRDMALEAGTLAIELSKWIDEHFALPTPNVPSMRGFESEAAAHALRADWRLGERVVRNIVHLLEANGVRIFSIPRDCESVSAFSFWYRDVPYIFLTTDKSGERGRFDAAHELAHLVLHRQGGPRSREAEFEADRFASAFLMPRSDVFAVAPRAPSLSLLMRLKQRWLVSLAALVHRLRDLALLTEWQYRALCIEIAQRGYRTNEPYGIQRESSQVLAKIFDSLRKEGLSRTAIARQLGMYVSDLDAIIFGLVTIAVSGGRTGESNSGDTKGRPRLRLI